MVQAAVVNKIAILALALGALSATSGYETDDERGYKTPPLMKAPQNSPALPARGAPFFSLPPLPIPERTPIRRQCSLGSVITAAVMSPEELASEEKALADLMAKARLK